MVAQPQEPREADAAGTEPASGGPPARNPRGKLLPIEAKVDLDGDRCVIRLPVRREEVTVGKETFVAGEATVRRVQVGGAQNVNDTVRAERLRVDVDGDVSVVRRQDVARVREDREEAR